MSIVVESDDAVFISSLARLVDDDRDVASDWAGKHIKTNKFIKWVIGRYVEADNANRNGQYWTLKDLQLKHDTVHHTPMNMGHRQHDVVGTVVASEMIYPSDEGNPYVETVGAFWKYYFPNELEHIETAYKSGNLWQSMEALSDTITCVGEGSCGESFQYQGPMSDSYCQHIQQHQTYRQMDNPHFLGAGLIIPPDRPGWSNAEIKDMSKLTTDEQKEELLASIAVEVPHQSPAQWETTMWALQFDALADQLATAKEQEEYRTPPSLISMYVANQFLATSWE